MIVPPFIKYKPRKKTLRAILHDSHTDPDVNKVEDVRRWASLAQKGAREMGLMSIGYHVIIERDAELVLCRDISAIGSHTPGCNMDSIGICWVGGRNGDPDVGVDNMTAEMKRTLLKFLTECNNIWPGLELVSHSEVQKYRNRSLPSCPPNDMELLRADFEYWKQGYTML